MNEDAHEFDTSDYSTDNKVGIIPNLENKKKVGVMKDECNGRILTEFVGLRSKMYSVRVEGKDTIKKSKGVKSNVIKQSITFDDYYECLTEKHEKRREQCNIRSKLHVVQTIRQSKIALSPFDTKRYLIDGSTDTLPWGHHAIPDAKKNVVGEAQPLVVTNVVGEAQPMLVANVVGEA